MKEYNVIGLCNYYGNVQIRQKNKKYYWSLEDYSGTDWHEISKELYELILKEQVK